MTGGCVFETEFGWCGVAFREGKLARCVTPRPNRQEAEVALGAGEMLGEDAFGGLPDRLRRYFAGNRTGFSDTKLDLAGLPPFARTALAECSKVPYGSVVTYAELARRMGYPNACRAVGRAMAANPVPIVIPCHRVIGSGGRLGGYSCGIDLKRRLLELEGVELHC